MKVVGDRDGPRAGEAQEMARGFIERRHRIGMREITHMRREYGRAPRCDAGRDLQAGTERQNIRPLAGEADWRGRGAPPAPDHACSARHDTRNAIIRPREDRPIMGHDEGGKSAQGLLGHSIIDDDRLPRDIAACHHQSGVWPERVEQQGLENR